MDSVPTTLGKGSTISIVNKPLLGSKLRLPLQDEVYEISNAVVHEVRRIDRVVTPAVGVAINACPDQIGDPWRSSNIRTSDVPAWVVCRIVCIYLFVLGKSSISKENRGKQTEEKEGKTVKRTYEVTGHNRLASYESYNTQRLRVS